MATPRPLKLLHLTDTHLFADPSASLRGTVPARSLARVLEHAAASRWRPHVVAMTGDVAQDESRGAYERLRDMLLPLGVPVHCTPGNHDAAELMREVLGELPFLYCSASQHGDWLVAAVNSRVPGAVGGRVEDSELERLLTRLEQATARHAVVCLHHPPLPVGSRWLDEVGLADAAPFLEALAASGKVRLILFGHVHQAFEGTFGPLRVIGTPSTCSQFTRSSADYAVSDEPPAYRRVALHPAGDVETELVWVGGRHAP